MENKDKIHGICCACKGASATNCNDEDCLIREVGEEVLFDLAELFKVFGDSTRIRIISALMGGEMCVYHLAQHLEMGQSAVSHQLRILRSAGLVRPRREGKEIYYSLDDAHIESIFCKGLTHILHKGGHLNERA